MRNAAYAAVEQALPTLIIHTGLLTDEVQNWNYGAGPGLAIQNGGQVDDPLDERILPEGPADQADNDYGDLQQIRTYTGQAIEALATYDTGAHALGDPRIMRGELYALEGYAEMMLADLFCSGVPLSTLDFQSNFTYRAGSTTTEVYNDALAKEDSALGLADTSTQVLNLARVLKGRALVDLGRYTEAAAAVTAVPDTFQYQVSTQWGLSGHVYLGDFFSATVADTEGVNGLPFISSGDPRSAVTTISCNNQLGNTCYFPVKYAMHLNVRDNANWAPVVVAGGIEARLIEAEADLQTNGSNWLTILNHLRQTAPIPGTNQPNPTALPPISDPVDPTARIDTMFTERAYWLFMTGHRQGDLRRLVRQYHRDQAQVYPTGFYSAPGTGRYGTDVNAPIPTLEKVNPLFHGCLDRHA